MKELVKAGGTTYAAIAYSYDAGNRLTLKNVPGGSTADVYYGYDLRGLQTFARFGSISGQGVTQAYDGFGRLTSSATNMGGTARTLSYQYDKDGNRTRVAYPDGSYFTYEHGGLDREYGETGEGSIVFNRDHQRSFRDALQRIREQRAKDLRNGTLRWK